MHFCLTTYSATSAQQANKTPSFFKNTRYTNKVLKQMKQKDYHSFPESVKAFESAGTVSRIKGGDGISALNLVYLVRIRVKKVYLNSSKNPMVI